MIVRELVTRLGFSTDEAAVKKYDKAMDVLANTVSAVESEVRGAVEVVSDIASEQIQAAKASDKMADAIDDAGREAGVLDGKLGMVITTIKTLVSAAGAAGAGLFAFLGIQNLVTSQTEQLAKAYGMSAAEFEAWGAVMESAGLQADTAGDLVEEMSNKIGEMKALGEMTAVEETFGAMGLAFEDIARLAPEEQFKAIMRQLEKMPDAQAAASIGDMLFGGEANKIITLLRNTEGSIDEIIDKQKSMNLLTDKGRAGAKKYAEAFKGAQKTIGSGMAELAGLVGGTFAPTLDSVAEAFRGWFAENRKIIQLRLERFISIANTAMMGMLRIVGGLISSVDAAAQKFGGWETILKLVGITIASILGIKAVTAIIALKNAFVGLNLAMLLNPAGLITAAIVALLVVIGLVIEDIYQWIQGNDSLFGAMFGGFDALVGKAKAAWAGVQTYFINPLWEALSAIGQIIAGAIALDWGMVQAGFERLGQAMVSWSEAIAAKIRAAIVGMLPEWMVDALSSVGRTVAGAASTAANVVSGGISALGNAAANMASPVLDVVAPGRGAGGNTINMPATVTVNVPPGTSQEQAVSIDKQVRESMMRQLRAAQQQIVVTE